MTYECPGCDTVHRSVTSAANHAFKSQDDAHPWTTYDDAERAVVEANGGGTVNGDGPAEPSADGDGKPPDGNGDGDAADGSPNGDRSDGDEPPFNGPDGDGDKKVCPECGSVKYFDVSGTDAVPFDRACPSCSDGDTLVGQYVPRSEFGGGQA